jgi:hypothetical protein
MVRPRPVQGDYTLSLLSGHYYPKEIVVEVKYNYTTNGV